MAPPVQKREESVIVAPEGEPSVQSSTELRRLKQIGVAKAKLLTPAYDERVMHLLLCDERTGDELTAVRVHCMHTLVRRRRTEEHQWTLFARQFVQRLVNAVKHKLSVCCAQCGVSFACSSAFVPTRLSASMTRIWPNF